MNTRALKILTPTSLLVILPLLASPDPLASPAAKPSPKRTLRALLITGGCCHDYAYQSKRLEEGSKQLANVEWTVMLDERRGTRGKIELYDDPDWAKPYDVIVHNECFAATKDPEYIRKITSAHHAGAPAVVIHCAMHTYRAAEIDDWRQFLGVTSRRHEHQAEYPIQLIARGHPVMQGFPENWKSPKDELYVLDKVWPGTEILAAGKSERDGRTHGAFWTHTYGEGRVFGTTFGHGNVTFDDRVFIETVTRGLLWAAGELTDAGRPSEGLEPAS